MISYFISGYENAFLTCAQVPTCIYAASDTIIFFRLLPLVMIHHCLDGHPEDLYLGNDIIHGRSWGRLNYGTKLHYLIGMYK